MKEQGTGAYGRDDEGGIPPPEIPMLIQKGEGGGGE